VVADALPRHPLEICQQAVEADNACKWIVGMRARIAENPAKFADYVEENDFLNRNLRRTTDDEDYIP